jgi:hypothetical protein
MVNYSIKKQHISTIKAGDTILHNSIMKTVTNKDIHYNSFMGISIFGDSYHIGNKLVDVVTIIKPKINLVGNN